MSGTLTKAYPFSEETQTHLDDALQSLIPLYAKVATRGDTNEALRQLKIQLREHVVWERNTIWREMIGLERKGWSGGGEAGGSRTMDKPIVMQKEMDGHQQDTHVQTFAGKFRIPRAISKESVGGAIAIIAFVAILSSNAFDRVEERNCLAILVLASIFWAMEVGRSDSTAICLPGADYSCVAGHTAFRDFASRTLLDRSPSGAPVDRRARCTLNSH